MSDNVGGPFMPDRLHPRDQRQMTKKPVYVTKPFLPPLEEFTALLAEIWSSGIVSNNGQFVRRLEAELCKYLGVEHLSLVNNGTTALSLAIAALDLNGEVITTPFSFVATAHALSWSGLTPVFVDIDPMTCNIDVEKIADAITDRTTAIMPVHCYGHPCEVETIDRLAQKFDLKVIYDAAHAFGVRRSGQSILANGDYSTVSFHATKVFNTFEGGAVISPDAERKRRIDLMRNFGFVDEVTVPVAGINGKMSEVNAAFGTLQLRYMDHILERRLSIEAVYRSHLKRVEGIRLFPPQSGVKGNGSYFPMLVEDSFPLSRDELYSALKESNIFGRRYFYPLISNLPKYESLASARPENLPVANHIADRILCLPIYAELSEFDQQATIDVLKGHGHIARR